MDFIPGWRLGIFTCEQSFTPSLSLPLISWPTKSKSVSLAGSFERRRGLCMQCLPLHGRLHPSMSWGKINDQLYNDILKEETLPSCISCHSYGHLTINCPTHSQATQSFCRSPAQAQQFTSGSTSSTTSSSKPLINTQQVNPSAPSQNFTCRDFNRRFCRRVNCQFLHICSNQGCGGTHPSTQCPKGV